MSKYTYILKKTFLIWGDCTYSKLQRPLNKNPITKYEKSSWVVGKGCLGSKICSLFLLPPEVEGKSLLMKTPSTSETGPRSLWAGTDMNVCPWGLTSMVPEVAKERSNQQSNSAMMPMTHINAWHDNLKGAIVSHIPWK